MGAKKPHEEHVNHERYMVTYADLITLLLAFFIILYAMADVNEEKFNAVAESLSVGFNQEPSISINTEMGSAQNLHKKRNQATAAERAMMEAVSEQNELRKVKNEIDEKVKEEGLEGEIKTEISDEGLKILLTNEVLFESGTADLKKGHGDIIAAVGKVISGLDNQVQVNGFTDNVPIKTKEFPSNWELSSARSLAVLKHMLEENKNLNPINFSSGGFGEYRPISSNQTKEGRKINRRVEILIVRENGEGLLRTN